MSINDDINSSFRSLITNNPFGICLLDENFHLQMLSRGAKKVFEGIEPLIGRDYAEILRIIWPEPFASEAIERIRHTLETGESYEAPTTVERRRNIDAVESYDWRTERLTLPGNTYGVVCYFYDLSERHQWEAALKESEEALATIIDSVPVGISVLDGKGNFLSTNPAAQNLVKDQNLSNLPSKLEQVIYLFEAFYPDGRPMPPGEWPAFRALRGDFVSEQELTLKRRSDGALSYLACSTTPLSGPKQDRVLMVLQDLTRHRESEKELTEKERDLRLLSNPILPVSKSIILLPLIGVINEKRSEQLRSEVLQSVKSLRARVVVIDVTGASEIDREAAESLSRTIKAARLQGAETIFSGISKELAEHMVRLRVSLDTVYATTGTLERGLEIARELVDPQPPMAEEEPEEESANPGGNKITDL